MSAFYARSGHETDLALNLTFHIASSRSEAVPPHRATSYMQVPRLHNLDMGGGGLLDIGMYVISIASWAFGTGAPSGVSGYGAISKNGVDVAGCVNLKCVKEPLTCLLGSKPAV